MKRYFIITMNLAMLCIWALHIQVSHAQAVNHEDLTKLSGKFSNGHLNDLNIHATRDFLKRFDNPADVKWYKEKDGYIVLCMLDSIKNTIAYNRKGDWVYTIKSYTESKLPREIRAFVKSVYYDYTIIQVEEIVQQVNNEPVYQIHMKGENTWKILLVGSNGEMVLLKDYDNS